MTIRTITAAAMLAAASSATFGQSFSLELLHNNDGESQLSPLSSGYGGAANFVSVINRQRAASTADATITLSSGDNFLAGTAFAASQRSGTYYDATVINNIGYDALALGNHDFDFGPDVLASFLSQTNSSIPYLSANLDFSAEPALAPLVGTKIKPSTIISYTTSSGTERVGVVGATTPLLPAISSPRNVVVNPVLPAVQAEVDALTTAGVNKIILISHLQSITEELSLIPSLRNVDAVIAGGGDELLNNTNPLIPGDTADGAYPLTAIDADGVTVPVVTTAGNYRYLGDLVLNFDGGSLTSFSGDSFRVNGNTADPDGVTADPDTQANAVAPVQAFESSLASNVIATTEVPLDGRRASIRTRETNYGNLIADSILDAGQDLAIAFDVDRPQVSFQNGGGIRNDTIVGSGATVGSPATYTELDSFRALPFANFVAVVEDVPAERLKQLLENAARGLEPGVTPGSFAQIAGMVVEYDLSGIAANIDVTGTIISDGSRVWSIMLDDGTILVENGMVLPGAPSVDLATIDFLARNGDSYPFTGLAFTTLGLTYQEALFDFISDDLAGMINAADYPVGGEGRITFVPEPTSAMALLAGGMLMLRRRK